MKYQSSKFSTILFFYAFHFFLSFILQNIPLICAFSIPSFPIFHRQKPCTSQHSINHAQIRSSKKIWKITRTYSIPVDHEETDEKNDMVQQTSLHCLIHGCKDSFQLQRLQHLLYEIFGEGVQIINIGPELVLNDVRSYLEYFHQYSIQTFRSISDANQSKNVEGNASQTKKIVFLASVDQDFIDYITQSIDQLGIGPIIVTAYEPSMIPSNINFNDFFAMLADQYCEQYQLMEKIIGTNVPQAEPPPIDLVLQAEIDGSLVHSQAEEEEGKRWDTSKLLVADNFIDGHTQKQLLDLITEPGWVHTQGPPESKWQKIVSDTQDELAQTWGLSEEALERLCQFDHPAVKEVHSRLSMLYPEYILTHLSPSVYGDHIAPMVANAPLPGDHFSWHIDADPNQVPPSPWSDLHGRYINREPGKPLFVTLLMYLTDGEWDINWHAETLFLDNPTGTGIFVQPKPGRIVLMDQDITHRLCAPSKLANRPRYSLVWKLVFHPKKDHRQDMSILKPDECEVLRFGSAKLCKVKLE